MMSNRTLLGMATLVAAALALQTMPVDAGRRADAHSAAENYKIHCQVCHAPDGDSPMPLLNFADGEWKNGSRVKDIAKIIADGLKASAMMPFKDKMTEAEILALAKYVRAFDKRLK